MHSIAPFDLRLHAVDGFDDLDGIAGIGCVPGDGGVGVGGVVVEMVLVQEVSTNGKEGAHGQKEEYPKHPEENASSFLGLAYLGRIPARLPRGGHGLSRRDGIGERGRLVLVWYNSKLKVLYRLLLFFLFLLLLSLLLFPLLLMFPLLLLPLLFSLVLLRLESPHVGFHPVQFQLAPCQVLHDCVGGGRSVFLWLVKGLVLEQGKESNGGHGAGLHGPGGVDPGVASLAAAAAGIVVVVIVVVDVEIVGIVAEVGKSVVVIVVVIVVVAFAVAAGPCVPLAGVQTILSSGPKDFGVFLRPTRIVVAIVVKEVWHAGIDRDLSNVWASHGTCWVAVCGTVCVGSLRLILCRRWFNRSTSGDSRWLRIWYGTFVLYCFGEYE
mmetsp:Transcript_8955/g.26665  ORF Transcript_8955/g.26665 Transcript_8955/m.26665 type:complete len:380 (+) Transcript_8955:78-1217(+)